MTENLYISLNVALYYTIHVWFMWLCSNYVV